MTDEEIIIKLTKHTDEIGSLKHRMQECEDMQQKIQDLIISVNQLATNMGHMLDEQRKQGARLAKLEETPVAEYTYYKRIIISCLLSGVFGAIVGAVLSLVI